MNQNGRRISVLLIPLMFYLIFRQYEVLECSTVVNGSSSSAGVAGAIERIEGDGEVEKIILPLLPVCAVGEDKGRGDSVVGKEGNGCAGVEARSVMYSSVLPLAIFNE